MMYKLYGEDALKKMAKMPFLLQAQQPSLNRLRVENMP